MPEPKAKVVECVGSFNPLYYAIQYKGYLFQLSDAEYWNLAACTLKVERDKDGSLNRGDKRIKKFFEEMAEKLNKE